MLYLLQVYLLVAIGILLAFFAVYLVVVLLRLGYLAAVRFVSMAKANVSGDVAELSLRITAQLTHFAIRHKIISG